MPGYWLRRALITLEAIFLFAVAGCSSQPQLGPIAAGESLSIKPPVNISSETDKISNDAIKSDAKTGAGGGAAAGAAWGLACGPFVIVCAPIGALAGAVVGGTTGAIVGSTRGLSDAQSANLKANVATYLDTNDPSLTANKFLEVRASKEWMLVDEMPNIPTLRIEIREISLNSIGSDQITLTMVMNAEVTYKSSSGKQPIKTGTFEYQSPATPVESWLSDRDDFIARRFEDGYITLTENIVASLLRGSG